MKLLSPSWAVSLGVLIDCPNHYLKLELLLSMTPVACLVLIDDSQSVFITQRPANKKLGGLWEFPGGKVENGESPESALRREIYEELNMKLGPLEPMSPVRHNYNFGQIELHPFLGRCSRRPTVYLVEHTNSDWVTFDELSVQNLVPADIPILTEIKSILDGIST